MKVRHLLMRIGAMIGENAIAAVFQAQIARYLAHGAKEAAGLRVAGPRRGIPYADTGTLGDDQGMELWLRVDVMEGEAVGILVDLH